ncbi:MAG TPA: class I SAM-dependent methyltransferase [Candidatus Nitrosotenuis sp.]|nr:class I SAM-dependent methyltransferase [Candidatus Nitrosotenuis sp.]
MAMVDFLSPLHRATRRDYLGRVNEFPKAEAASVARRFGPEYWDGDRRYGYGGYVYDGRWLPVAEKMARHYDLRPGQRVLDVGCGKAFLLYELTRVVPGLQVAGLDISEYALTTAPEPVRPFLTLGTATELPYGDQEFDLVLSINVVHNLYVYDAKKALEEIMRVGRRHRYVVVESYRTEEEKANLLYWQLTCECFFTPQEWQWLFDLAGYQGDHSFIFFE